ncbi:MAG: PAS domain S-box protein [Actinomycetes bacterium]
MTETIAPGNARHSSIPVQQAGDDASAARSATAIDDVAEQQRYETQLRQSEAVFHNTLEGILVTDEDGIVLRVNPAFTAITGWQPEQVVGRHAQLLASADHRQEEIDWVRGDLTSGPGFQREFMITRPDGAESPALVSVNPIPDPTGAVTGYVAVITDISDRVRAERALAESEKNYRLLAENAVDVVTMVDLSGAFTWVSPSSRDVCGYEPADLIGGRSTMTVHPLDVPVVEAVMARANGGESGIYHEVRILTAAGQYHWMAVTASNAVDEDGAVVGHITSARDIHDLVLARQALADSEHRYRLLAENASDVIWQVSTDGRLEWASESVTAMLGWDPGQVLGRMAEELIHPDDRYRASATDGDGHSGGTTAGRYRMLRADGSFRWMSLHQRSVHDGDTTFQVVTLRDVQEEVEARAELEHVIEHDQLTGLAKLPATLTRIDALLAALPKRPQGRTVAVLCVGVDSLKSVNEAFTYAAGDRVLITVATRLASVCDNPELLARGSGDEFLVVLPNLASGADAGIVADQIRLACKGTITIGGHPIEPTVSIGIATGQHGSRAEELVRNANLAKRQAKANGHDRYEFVDPRLANEARRRLTIEADIRDGLRAGQLVPWFQPIVELDGGQVVGYEALVRWVRPDGSLVLPDQFLPFAERSTLITELDFAVLTQSMQTLKALPPQMHVAVNVSASTLTSPDYLERVVETLSRSGVDPARLHLEFTETALLGVTDRVRDIMSDLAQLGVRWYVDDFGTGYSSIAHLRDLPIAGLKLDRSFTSGLAADDLTCERLAKALAGLADGLGLDTVAEGVETPAEAAVLRAQGWQHGQGWLYGRPAPLG